MSSLSAVVVAAVQTVARVAAVEHR